MFKALAGFGGFSVDDMAKAKQFYTEVLGLEMAGKEMEPQLKLPGGGYMFLYEKPNHQPATYTVLNFVVEDIDAAVDALAAKGVEFELYDNMPGAQDEKGVMRGRAAGQGPDIAWFKDPAGNIISVLQDK